MPESPVRETTRTIPDECVAWVRERLLLSGFVNEMWQDSHDEITRGFLNAVSKDQPPILIAWIAEGKLLLESNMPHDPPTQLFYYVKDLPERVVTLQNVHSSVLSGVAQGNTMESFLGLMSSVFLPMCRSNGTWPASIKKEFIGSLHKFMAGLVEVANQIQGRTVMYIPEENLEDMELSSKDKDLVQRLEYVLIQWTRQIKEVVSNQDNNVELGEEAGPLDEIEFWKRRSDDLNGISQQLTAPGVQRIVQVLSLYESSYLEMFEEQSNLIKMKSDDSQRNLMFLRTLDEPCRALQNATPAEIPKLLPAILNCIRLIWGVKNGLYSRKETLTDLLRKLSNDLIKRCMANIDIGCIFKGDVAVAMAALNDSISCCHSWRHAYERSAQLIEHVNPERSWNFEASNIFAQVDAFTQRCGDLIQVCEGRTQFALKSSLAEDDDTNKFPVFAGTKGGDIARSLQEIEEQFHKRLEHLRSLDYSILDVKATAWHEDYNTFKKGIKELEDMLTTLISTAFEGVNSVIGGIDLLEAFHHIAKRDAIVRCLDVEMRNIFNLFHTELTDVKKEFDMHRRNPKLNAWQPGASGAVEWAKSIIQRVQEQFQKLDGPYYITSTREFQDAKGEFQRVLTVLEDYIAKLHKDWVTRVEEDEVAGAEAGVAWHLQCVLMKRIEGGDGLIMGNFDQELHHLFAEVRNFKLSGMDVPAAAALAADTEKFRCMQENVMLVVREYNSILTRLSHTERMLFRDRIHYADKKITQGLSKLTWDHKKVYGFLSDARRVCKEVSRDVSAYHAGNLRISQLCHTMANTLLVSFQKKEHQVYEFEAMQEKHRTTVKAQFETVFKEIKAIARSTYQIFRLASGDVQEHWVSYVEQIDKQIEAALRSTVKKSLQEISRSIVGDKKHEVKPIFKVNVVLEGVRVEFRPTMGDLRQMVQQVAKDTIDAISIIPRLIEVIDEPDSDAEDDNEMDEKERERAAKQAPKLSAAEILKAEQAKATALASKQRALGKPTFHEVISNDDDFLRIVALIMGGMATNIERMGKELIEWERYKDVWNQDKDRFMQRYAKMTRQLASFDSDITRFRELQAKIQNEDNFRAVFFVLIEFPMIKVALTNHCIEWEAKFLQLLNSISQKELTAIFELFLTTQNRLEYQSNNLDELGEQLELMKATKMNLEATEERFDPLKQKYDTLEKFDKQVTDEEKESLLKLVPEFESFQEMLKKQESQLEKRKMHFKDELLRSQEDFNGIVQELAWKFKKEGPFGGELTVKLAFESMKAFLKELDETNAKKEQIAKGLKVYNIEQPVYAELSEIKNRIDQLDEMWTMRKEWEKQWDQWSVAKFRELDAEAMGDDAGKYKLRVRKIGRQIEGVWGVWTKLKEAVDEFIETLPLLQNLRDGSMRPRHWDNLKKMVGKEFDPYADNFDMGTLSSLGLHAFATEIETLVDGAKKEEKIESKLKEVTEIWGNLDCEIKEYKQYHKLATTEDINSYLDDHMVTISAMKASRFKYAFEAELNQWEMSLTVVTDVIELILQVQRNWMYLENIFVGQEDIQRQLPQESAMFHRVNGLWKDTMVQLLETKNVVSCAHVDGLKQRLEDMDETLEKIQKSLDEYLEMKRQAFPRFYFLSNDELLEILGQARDPKAVQPFFRKCFEGINKLRLQPPGEDGRRTFEADAMYDPGGEQVEFSDTVVITGMVETWLTAIETMMLKTVKDSLKATKDNKKIHLAWIKAYPGQLLITAGQMDWTTQVQKQLQLAKSGKRGAMKRLKKDFGKNLAKLILLVQSPQLKKLDRKKLIALITIEVHSREVIEKLVKLNVDDPMAWNWVCQLRFRGMALDEEDCIVEQTITKFTYGYEYLGNCGRLVITPLTDRCYMTLTTALHLNKGGNPLGPAGTGKTETVKDLAKSLSMMCIVVNCSDGMDYKSLGRMFSGLAQCGAWSCFDEFNRIEVEVLSVVAQQMLCIFTAILNNLSTFVFEGIEIRLKSSCGIFVTMNPGYAGRSELPDNLKALLRPIAMMTPDLTLIVDISLIAEGFTNSMALAKKLTKLYELCQQQLSKQDHYDFGLRNIKSVLGAAGALKRNEPEYSEDLILFRALRDMNITKFVTQDAKLFLALMSDLFPSIDAPTVDYGVLEQAIRKDLTGNNLQEVAFMIEKCIQVYEIKLTRHGNMLVGRTGSGKSTAWKTLVNALTALAADPDISDETFQNVRLNILNPKAISNDELYGAYDMATMEWQEGILPKIMREACRDESEDQKWLIFDGPVDTLWIESMNTCLDDNKLLTLINGERIAMVPQVSLLFEVGDLSVASPATVSRAGMIYLDISDLGWQPYMTSWLNTHQHEAQLELLTRLVERLVQPLLDFRTAECTQLVPALDVSTVVSLTRLFDSLMTAENGVSEELFVREDSTELMDLSELFFFYACVWSIGASLDESSRRLFDLKFHELEVSRLPNRDSVYDWFVDTKKRGWMMFAESALVPSSWRPDVTNTPFYKIIVPTADTARNGYTAGLLIKSHHPVLLVGGVGNGKTVCVESTINKVLREDEKFSTIGANFSAQTSSEALQSLIEAKLDKRGNAFAPSGGKTMIVFVDDFNMPEKDLFGSQPPLELLRLWMSYGFWYDRTKQTEKRIIDTQLICAMGPPGGSRAVISERIQSKFNLINVTAPSDDTMRRIFGVMINQKLLDFDESFKSLGEQITTCTISLYQRVAEKFLPTPTRPIYLFNLRDVGKVFEGMLCINKDYCDNRETMIRLWVHESLRVFADRMICSEDKHLLQNEINDLLSENFEVSWKKLMEAHFTAFGSFMRELEEPVYEEILSEADLKAKLEFNLDEYNETPKVVQMSLVLFRDAMEHIMRIHRVLSKNRGNMLLVGVGGSGRQSLTKLAAGMLEMSIRQIEITSKYRVAEFKDDIKAMFEIATVQNKKVCFIFSDTQIVDEAFMEIINCLLSSGDVPNLFPKDEIAGLCDSIRPLAKKHNVEDTPEHLFKFAIETARNNLHVVTCMSPVGDAFRTRVRMFPALCNNTTIDWFLEWPVDALEEVALKFLEDVQVDNEGSEGDVRGGLARTFAIAHATAVSTSNQMLAEAKRNNYITPTHFLELVKGYIAVLAQKRKVLVDSADKLRNGLQKLMDSQEQVEYMSAKMSEQKVVVEVAQKECSELLVTIVQEKRIADDEEKKVSAEEKIISKDKAECERTAADCGEQLAKAIPALEKAEKALENLKSSDIAEVKQYKTPPDEVVMVMQSIMCLRKDKGKTWDDCKKVLTDPKFLSSLKFFDKSAMDKTMTDKVMKFTSKETYKPDWIAKKSGAAAALSEWVIAMKVYGEVAQIVEPKKRKLADAEKTLSRKLKELKAAQDKLGAIQAQVANLQKQFDDSNTKKAKLEAELAMLEEKLERAQKIVTGLSSERDRWGVTIGTLETQEANLVGDVVVACSFCSYAGPFPSEYREEMVSVWLNTVKEQALLHSEDFKFVDFLANPVDIRNWVMQGLPTDNFSTENGVLVTGGTRWPLMVDPQAQANKWVKKMEQENNLVIVDPKSNDLLRTFEHCIGFGTPVLMEDILLEVDPALEPVLGKQLLKRGASFVIKVGDKEVDFNENFKFYLTTKLANPHYPPEVSTKTSIINFSVKQQGLEDQLLGIFIQKEKEELEIQKNETVLMVAKSKNKLVELEDLILYQLSTVEGSLIDNKEVCETLTQSKITSNEVNDQLEKAAITEVEIDEAREIFRPVAQRASQLYFVLVDMGKVDPMYQFSLDSYNDLFVMSILQSRTSGSGDLAPEERIRQLKEWHTLSVYRSTCRGLFEKHKLLFSLLICMKKLMEEAVPPKVAFEEYQFFLRGPLIMDRSTLRENAFSEWLDDQAWEALSELEKLPNFRGFLSSLEQSPRDWKAWYRLPNPESKPLPGDWNNKLDDFQRMVVLRSLRTDRVIHAVTSFITTNVGPEYVQPPVLKLLEVVETSTPTQPLIFVLSTGADPTNMLRQLSAEQGIDFRPTALGQGQAPYAISLMDDGKRSGQWVFLANCHLMLSWLPTLEKIIMNFPNDNPHPNFRLWLSSVPHPNFPIAILQKGVKMTTEPPKGLKPNLTRLYNNISEEKFNTCGKRLPYQRLLFSLCFFHSVLLERRKFLTLGWNIPYEFNDSDIDTAELILCHYLNAYDEVPWEALRYLIAEATYGGRVTDDWDRRLLNVYMADYFNTEVIQQVNFRLSPLSEYYTPDDGPLKSYKEYVGRLPQSEQPLVFGQHGNAEISSQITNSQLMLETMVSLQSASASAGGSSIEDTISQIASDLLSSIPGLIPIVDIQAMLADEPSPLNVVLLQESERYNAMLSKISSVLGNLLKGIKGLVVMSAELEQVFDSLAEGKVPPAWLKTYPSVKPLASWSIDLIARIKQLTEWTAQGHPVLLWIGGLTFPTGYLTGLLQLTARKNNQAIDAYSWAFDVLPQPENEITNSPKEGSYMCGMFLEGAGWSYDNMCLEDPEPMKLVVPMPVIHFKPVERSKRSQKGVYQCPLYLYPVRTGTRERPSFMIVVELKTGPKDPQARPEYWTKRGTALMLALAN
eukprot:TRINITY_DN3494_c0_g2_i1.p1 TRINITY_DN3494_c0_g2~~TRINITY_DN3494_c0_g2_i1.p1  ORF type:complete len:4527 (-),score=1335.50 TRINITY_DN3494_c0_g2_i1:103-13683(-)